MITVIALVLAGALFGFLMRARAALLKSVNVLVNAAIYILLLLLGISVGSNKEIIQNLGTIGIKSSILTIGAVAGSIAVGVIFQKLAFKENENEK
jgi:uncharacterized membrane protein YbjE (DUF340 family)